MKNSKSNGAHYLLINQARASLLLNSKNKTLKTLRGLKITSKVDNQNICWIPRRLQPGIVNLHLENGALAVGSEVDTWLQN